MGDEGLRRMETFCEGRGNEPASFRGRGEGAGPES